ncbi:DUF2735 domain-containing protein [Chenggangzhangella methanolivorans]|uniref:DUF2735 domain-containing protein n=1 Tax=Chenggangzhangella methanolivorans TaxID=1437009 RepID=A0A9E6RBH6_9HYPH|nr:DUF2735 domain-containing protein [Chenggangzhangella methanolivorans]QZO00810.1 DUF2735 domain-containing protein [Chenggangzhangella methanolivorans]
MTPDPIRGSAKILDFRPRTRSGAAPLPGRTAEIAQLRVSKPIYAVAAVDIDSWYHAEAVADAQPAGKH